jgi:type IV pilus assembly protein PilM
MRNGDFFMSDTNNSALSPETHMAGPEFLKIQETLERGKTVIGIDIGISSVNVVQTALYKGKTTLIKTAVENIVLAHERERDSVTMTALKRVLSVFNARKADVICVVSSRQTTIENMIMPIMPLQELMDAVKIELSNSQQFVMERQVLGIQSVGRIMDKGVEKMSVVAVLIPKTAVDHILSYFTSRKAKPLVGMEHIPSEAGLTGLDVAAIIPPSVAMENIIKKSRFRMDETMAIIEMGTLVTELSIYHNSRLEFSRKIAVAGVDLTRSLTSSFFTNTGKVQLTIEEAEVIKRQYGIPAPEENYLILGKITASQVLPLLRPKLEQMVAEIRRSLDYYHEKMRASSEVGRIILFGGGAQLKGLTEFLNAELGLPVDLGDPRQDVELLFNDVLQDKSDAQRLVQAIGASLGDPSGINLLPAHLKERKKRSLEMIVAVAMIAVFLVVSGGVYAATEARRNAAHQKLLSVKNEYQALLPKVIELKDGLKLKKFVRNRTDLGVLLKQLSYVPSYVYLTELNLKSGRISLSGFVIGNDKDAQGAPLQLVENLRKGILKDAQLSPMRGAPQAIDPGLPAQPMPPPQGAAAQPNGVRMFEITAHIGRGERETPMPQGMVQEMPQALQAVKMPSILGAPSQAKKAAPGRVQRPAFLKRGKR